MSAVLTLTLLASTFAQPSQRPADFDFRLEYGCWANTVDTFRGEFLRTMDPSAPPLSRVLTLRPEVLDRVHQTVTAARFFEYASDYHEPPAAETALRFPARSYFLDVRINGIRHAVRWSEPVVPHTPAGLRLQDMFEKLVNIVEGLAEVQRMPVPNYGCM